MTSHSPLPEPPAAPRKEKRMTLTWQPIESAPEFVTVLTQHVDDLYPVPAFRAGKEWLREAEGPEDTEDGRPGKYGPLYRTPTHWMSLPEPPIRPEPPQ